MIYESYAHRFADIILNADYALKLELESVVQAIGFEEVQARFEEENLRRKEEGKKLHVGKQPTINKMFKAEFRSAGWELEKNVFKVGVYICPTRAFAKEISRNWRNMVNYERAKWYLENFYAVLTAPMLLIGLRG